MLKRNEKYLNFPVDTKISIAKSRNSLDCACHPNNPIKETSLLSIAIIIIIIKKNWNSLLFDINFEHWEILILKIHAKLLEIT